MKTIANTPYLLCLWLKFEPFAQKPTDHHISPNPRMVTMLVRSSLSLSSDGLDITPGVSCSLFVCQMYSFGDLRPLYEKNTRSSFLQRRWCCRTCGDSGTRPWLDRMSACMAGVHCPSSIIPWRVNKARPNVSHPRRITQRWPAAPPDANGYTRCIGVRERGAEQPARPRNGPDVIRPVVRFRCGHTRR
jgi:hypothetical protein